MTPDLDKSSTSTERLRRLGAQLQMAGFQAGGIHRSGGPPRVGFDGRRSETELPLFTAVFTTARQPVCQPVSPCARRPG